MVSSKGQGILDFIFVLIVLFAFAIIGIFSYVVLKDFNTDFQADPDISATAKGDLQGLTTNFPSYIDNSFTLLLGLFWVFLVISAWFADSHPLFFVVMIILVSFVLVAGMILSNAYDDVKADPDITGYTSGFPQMNWVMSHLLMVLMGMGFSCVLAMYGRSRV